MRGRYIDPETGYLYLRARYYDPATAQFLTRDPMDAVTRSAYGYVENDPLNGSDPSGLCGPFGDGPCTPGGIASDLKKDAKKVVNKTISTVSNGDANCVRYATCSSHTESLGDNHPFLRDSLYLTLGVAATVASGGLLGEAAGVLEGGALLSGSTAGYLGIAAGGIAAYGDYGPCVHGRDELACAGLVTGGLGALLGFPALLPGELGLAFGTFGLTAGMAGVLGDGASMIEKKLERGCR